MSATSLSSAATIHCRLARPEDAGCVAHLYRAAYTARDAGAEDRYPFPQFLDRGWLHEAFAQPELCWGVAEADGQVIASAGAVKNIGSPQDRVAELFGIVVDEPFRGLGRQRPGQGVGTRLARFICAALPAETSFVICESRTALIAAWRVARNAGFAPLGFEAAGHRTPAGYESMLLTGSVSAEAASERSLEPIPDWLAPLARSVLSPLGLPLPPTVTRSPTGPRGDEGPEFRVIGDRATARRWLAAPSVSAPASGVVGLDRLEGVESSRSVRRYYVGLLGSRVVAAARVSWDRIDCRARVLRLESECEAWSARLMQAICQDLKDKLDGGPLSLVVEVRGGAIELQSELRRLGFSPTVYYPGYVACADQRHDGVQYALFSRHFPRSQAQGLACLAEWRRHWPAAAAMTDVVLAAMPHL